MARPRTFRDLQNLADIAKKRETMRAAAKLAAVPAPWKERGTKSNWYFKSAEDQNIWVTMPIYDDTIAFVTTAALTALGGYATTAPILLITGATIVDFRAKNQDVLRIRIHDSKATPTQKNTPWGTRVVDKIDKSYSIPMTVTGTDGSLAQAKAQFRAAFTGTGVLASKLVKKGNYAELYLGKKLLEVAR